MTEENLKRVETNIEEKIWTRGKLNYTKLKNE